MQFASIVYVDPTISAAGDGATPTTALKAIPPCKDLPADVLYIVRRTSAKMTMTGINYDPYGGGPDSEQPNSATVRLGIWAMPAADDDRYAAIPQAARDAWGADAAVRPVLSFPAATGEYQPTPSFMFQNLRDLSLYGVEVESLGTSTSDPYGPGGGSALLSSSMSAVDANKHYGAVSVVDCVFRGSADWSESGTPVAANGSDFIKITAADTLAFRRNKVVYAPGGNAFDFGNIRRTVNIVDNEVYMAASGYAYIGEGGGPGGTATCFSLTKSPEGSTFTFRRNHGHVVFLTSGGAVPGFVAVGDGAYYDVVRATDCSVTVLRADALPETCTISAPIYMLPRWRLSGDIRNLSLAVPQAAGYPYEGVVFIAANTDQLASFSCVVDNISIELGTEPIGTPLGDDRLDITDGNYGNAHYMALYAKYVCATNVHVANPIGIGLYAENSSVSGDEIGGRIVNTKSVVRCDTCTGNCTRNAIHMWNSPCITSIGTLTVSDTAEADLIWGVGGRYHISVWIGACNKPVRLTAGAINPTTDLSSTTWAQHQTAIQCASNGAPGRYAMWSLRGLADTWECTRFGSASPASIRLSHPGETSSMGAAVGQCPGSIIVGRTSAGRQTATLYFALAEGVTPADVEFTLLTDKMTYNSYTDGLISADTSKWTGGGGCTAYKWTVAIESEAPGDLGCQIVDYAGTGASKYIYVDPIAILS